MPGRIFLQPSSLPLRPPFRDDAGEIVTTGPVVPHHHHLRPFTGISQRVRAGEVRDNSIGLLPFRRVQCCLYALHGSQIHPRPAVHGRFVCFLPGGVNSLSKRVRSDAFFGSFPSVPTEVPIMDR
jgi:hypothetical protein